MIDSAEFERLVAEALDQLPPFFQERMDNIEVLVRDWPTRQDLREAGLTARHHLLGLYYGVPLTDRTQGYNLVPPDIITLFQRPIELVAGDNPEEIRAQVRHTVIHEVAHHFGISDDRLRDLGAY